MNDKDIFLRLLQQAYADDSLSQAVKKEFEKLVNRFDEDNADLEISIRDLTDVREKILRSLSDKGYTAQSLRYHGPNDGHILHVNLRGKKYLELANDTRSVVVGMNDSGQRQSFETGAVRDTAEGKTRPDLISPFSMDRLGEWLRLGAMKYAERNWEKGIPISRSLASLYRHLLKYQQGATDEDHMAAIMCNAMFIMHTEDMIRRGRLPETLADMPDYSKIPGAHSNGDPILETEDDFQWKKLHNNI